VFFAKRGLRLIEKGVRSSFFLQRKYMKIKIDYIKDIAVLVIDGKININSSKLIESIGLLLDKGTSKIVIDMHNVEFVDYNGLSVLAIIYKNTLNYKGVMKLCGISIHIQELLRVVKLDDVFEIYDNLDDALESFKRGYGLHGKALGQKQQPLRRRFTRLELDIPISYSLVKGGGDKTSNIYPGRLENISGAGLFVRSIHILPPGSEVLVEIITDQGKDPKGFVGVVMWLADKGFQPELYPGMGIAFTDISGNMQEQILDFIEKNTVHRRV
jgi:anti-anti-sigma factor